MSEKRKLLIIENQYTQFCRIYSNLGTDKFDKFPDSDQNEYINFIDHVRIWVNENYLEQQKTNALKFITELITANSIELILMDHILGGAHHCKTGIDLAYEINQSRKDNGTIIPVLFLSKTDLADKKREIGSGNLKGINEYASNFGEANYKWVHKGYFGDEILDPDYFRDNVMTKIEELLGDSELDKFKKLLDEILSLNYNEDNIAVKAKLEKLKSSSSIDKGVISSITAIYNENLASDNHRIPEKLKEFFNE